MATSSSLIIQNPTTTPLLGVTGQLEVVVESGAIRKTGAWALDHRPPWCLEHPHLQITERDFGHETRPAHQAGQGGQRLSLRQGPALRAAPIARREASVTL